MSNNNNVSFAPGIIPVSVNRFLSTAINPVINQTTSTATEIGDSLTLQAQNVTGGTTSVGGKLVLQSGSGTLTGAAAISSGEIELKHGASTASSFRMNNSGDYRFILNANLPYMVFSANGAGQFLAYQANQGALYFDSPSTIFRDASSLTCLTVNGQSSGTTTLTFAQGTSPSITQATRTSNNPTSLLSITTQAPFATATGVNGSSGSLLLSFPTPVSTGMHGSLIRRYGAVTSQIVNMGHKTTTTNSTPTTGISYPLQDNSTTYFNAKIVARDATNNLHNVYELKAAAKRQAGGNATLIGTADQDFVKEEAPAWDAVVSVSDINIIITLTGAPASTVNWFIALEAQTYSV